MLTIGLSSDDIQQLVGDHLLTALVVLQGQFLGQVVGVVVGDLHRHHPGGVLGGQRVQQRGVDRQVQEFWKQEILELFDRRLVDEIFHDRFPFLIELERER